MASQEARLTGFNAQPPWESLLSASRVSLQSYELSRLRQAANLRKEIAALLDQWVDESSAAMLARYLMDLPERTSRAPETAPAAESLQENGHAVSDNLFPDRAASPRVNPAHD